MEDRHENPILDGDVETMSTIYVLMRGEGAPPDGVRVVRTVEEFADALRGAADLDIAVIAGDGLWMFWQGSNPLLLSSAQYDFLKAISRYTYVQKHRVSCLQAAADIARIMSSAGAYERRDLAQAVTP